MEKQYRSLIERLTEQKKDLRAEADKAESVDKLKELEAKLSDIESQIAAANAELAKLEEEPPADDPEPETEPDPAPEEGRAEDCDPEEREEGTAERSANTKNPQEDQHPMPEKRTVIHKAATAEAERQERMKRVGEDLLNKRSVTVSGGTLLVPKKYKEEIAGMYRQFSTLVDSVNQVPLAGGESYQAPYEISVAAAINGTEGVAPGSNTEPTFGYVDINKAKLVAYAEITEEVKKLPTANYAERVIEAITIALKKKVSQEIMTGDGSTNHFTGLFSTAAGNKCVRVAKDIAITAIDENTLMSIIGQVGGDEELEGDICLILSKSDLLTFAKLRDAVGGNLIHKVDFTNHTIDGIRYFINSNCNTVSSASAGDYCMAAGILSSYEEAIFSDIEVTESTDYKFKEGMICYRGTVFAGGNTTKYDGFIRVKKGA